MKRSFWKHWFLILTGLFVMALPWTGFPGSMKDWLYFGSGAFVILLAFSLARTSAGSVPTPSSADLSPFDEERVA